MFGNDQITSGETIITYKNIVSLGILVVDDSTPS